MLGTDRQSRPPSRPKYPTKSPSDRPQPSRLRAPRPAGAEPPACLVRTSQHGSDVDAYKRKDLYYSNYVPTVSDLVHAIRTAVHEVETRLSKKEPLGAESLLFAPNAVPDDVICDFLDLYDWRNDETLQIRKFENYGTQVRVTFIGATTVFHDITIPLLVDIRVDMIEKRWITAVFARKFEINQDTHSFGANHKTMIPDACISSVNYAGGRWSNLITEIGNTQSYDELLYKKSKWFHESDGQVTVFVLLKYLDSHTTAQPMAFLQIWRCVVLDRDDNYVWPPPNQITGFSACSPASQLASVQAAVAGRSPRQKIVTYQEGPDYWIFPESKSQFELVPLTFADWFGPTTVPPPGRKSSDVFPIPLDLIREKVIAQKTKHDNRKTNPKAQGAYTPPPAGKRRRETPEPPDDVEPAAKRATKVSEDASLQREFIVTQAQIDKVAAELQILVARKAAQNVALAGPIPDALEAPQDPVAPAAQASALPPASPPFRRENTRDPTPPR